MSVARALLARALELPLEQLAARPLQPLEVAVVDSGMDAAHPDLAGRVVEQFAVEVDAERRPRLVPVALGSNNDSYWHGTAVGGIIAGLAPNVSLVDIRVLGADNRATSEGLLKGLAYAIERGSRIVNLSLAAADSSKAALFELLEKAYYADQIVVAARRNFPAAGDGWPAALSACIGVGRETFERASQFHWWKRNPVEIFGRGEDVVVAVPGGGYTTTFGTSFATPAISGLVALLLGAEPELGPTEIKAVLKAHALELR